MAYPDIRRTRHPVGHFEDLLLLMVAVNWIHDR